MSTIESEAHICDFLLASHSNLGPILQFQRYSRWLCLRLPLFHHISGVFPLDQIADVGVNVTMCAGTLSYSVVKSFSNYCNLC